MRKEVEAYEKEVITNEGRIQKMRDEGRDIYGNLLYLSICPILQFVNLIVHFYLTELKDIRKQEEVLQESYMMIPDSKTRLERAMEELESLYVRLAAIISYFRKFLTIFYI